MSDFADLYDHLDPNLVLPIDGVDYVIPPPSVNDGIRLRLFYADVGKPTQLDRLIWQAKLLGAEYDPVAETFAGADGSVWDQMIANGLSATEIFTAGSTAILFYGLENEAAAHMAWGDRAPLAQTLEALSEGGDQGKAQNSNRKQRRAKPKKAS